MTTTEVQPLVSGPVHTHTEWDPLEEVIVGRVDGAMFSFWDPVDSLTFTDEQRADFCRGLTPGSPFPNEYIEAGRRQLDGLVHILEREGVTVRRPEEVRYNAPISTPDWCTPNGLSSANPRDPFLVIGDEIIETPMCVRTRSCESVAYRSLFNEYFQAGARWTAAPRPRLDDPLYDTNYQRAAHRFVLTEHEPVFDGADFVRCGRDIFGQLSHVTNRLGVEWLRRHLGDEYRVHLIENRDPYAVHIDTTFMPLAPGKVLVNPDYLDIARLPSILSSWEVLVAPKPVPFRTHPKVVSDWISMNTLMLDETRILVERRQEPLLTALKNWGFEPIPLAFEHYYPFMGGIHCATLDIRRRGALQSYF